MSNNEEKVEVPIVQEEFGYKCRSSKPDERIERSL